MSLPDADELTLRLHDSDFFVQACREWAERTRLVLIEQLVYEEDTPQPRIMAFTITYESAKGLSRLIWAEDLADFLLEMVHETGQMSTGTQPINALENFYGMGFLGDIRCTQCRGRYGAFTLRDHRLCAHCWQEYGEGE